MTPAEIDITTTRDHWIRKRNRAALLHMRKAERIAQKHINAATLALLRIAQEER